MQVSHVYYNSQIHNSGGSAVSGKSFISAAHGVSKKHAPRNFVIGLAQSLFM
jgi:hypothetical protein